MEEAIKRGWLIGQKLGSGLCGSVYLSYEPKERRPVALKVVDFKKVYSHFRQKITVSWDSVVNLHLREVEILSLFQHPNIVQIDTWFRTEDFIFIGMEMVEGCDLLNLIEEEGALSESVIRLYFSQICLGIQYCHKCGVVHGDVKPENILVKSDGTIKIIDFGFSHLICEEKLWKVMGGTKLYSPPADPKVSFAWDNWSCGVVLYAMFCGALPFSLEELGKRVVTLEIPPEIPDGVLWILEKLLQPDWTKRGTISEILRDSQWLGPLSPPSPLSSSSSSPSSSAKEKPLFSLFRLKSSKKGGLPRTKKRFKKGKKSSPSSPSLSPTHLPSTLPPLSRSFSPSLPSPSLPSLSSHSPFNPSPLHPLPSALSDDNFFQQERPLSSSFSSSFSSSSLSSNKRTMSFSPLHRKRKEKEKKKGKKEKEEIEERKKVEREAWGSRIERARERDREREREERGREDGEGEDFSRLANGFLDLSPEKEEEEEEEGEEEEREKEEKRGKSGKKMKKGKREDDLEGKEREEREKPQKREKERGRNAKEELKERGQNEEEREREREREKEGERIRERKENFLDSFTSLEIGFCTQLYELIQIREMLPGTLGVDVVPKCVDKLLSIHNGFVSVLQSQRNENSKLSSLLSLLTRREFSKPFYSYFSRYTKIMFHLNRFLGTLDPSSLLSLRVQEKQHLLTTPLSHLLGITTQLVQLKIILRQEQNIFEAPSIRETISHLTQLHSDYVLLLSA